jgi:apolipoprotein N-acyltransferase
VASANNSRRLIEGLLAFATTTALVYYGNGLNPIWPLMWIAPLPVLWFALRSSPRAAALVAGLAWLAGCLNFWRYFHILGLPFVAWLSGFGLAAIVFMLAVLLFRALVLRGAPWAALISLPAVWVTFEYLRNLTWPHGTAGCLAYSQLYFLPFLQLASLTGPWGMSFFLLFVPTGLAITLHLRRTAPSPSRCILAATLGTLAALLIFGAIRLAIPQPGPKVPVGLIASDGYTARPGPDTQRLLQDYAQHVRDLATQGAQAIVLPEKLVTITNADRSSADTILQQVADQTGVVIVSGVDRETPTAAYNQARIYRPGIAVATYNKEHLLPPFESRFTPGTSLLLLQISTSPWGIAICKDMDFTQLSRKYGRDRVGLMLVPGWDFNIDRAWHGHIAIMRSVEDGFSVVRSAKGGYLTISDNRGRILAERRSNSAPFATLSALVPTGHSWTLFQLLGDWFAWLAIVLSGWTILRLTR